MNSICTYEIYMYFAYTHNGIYRLVYLLCSKSDCQILKCDCQVWKVTAKFAI